MVGDVWKYFSKLADNFQCHVNLDVLFVGDLNKATYYLMFVWYSHSQNTPASSL